MVKRAHHEDRQRHERRAIGAGNDVGGRRQFADVELDLAHHPAEGPDLRLHVREMRFDALDRNAARQNGLRVGEFGNGECQGEERLGHCGTCLWLKPDYELDGVITNNTYLGTKPAPSIVAASAGDDGRPSAQPVPDPFDPRPRALRIHVAAARSTDANRGDDLVAGPH